MRTLILAMFMCYASYAQANSIVSNVNLTVVYYSWNNKPYTVSFLLYNYVLTRFKDCLCSASSVSCNIVVEYVDAFAWKHYSVESIVDDTMTSKDLSYPINYLCEFDTFDTRSVLCRREGKGSNALRTFFYINESHCELTCVGVSWNDSQNVTLSKNKIFVISKGGLSPVCGTTTSNTVNTTPLQSTTFSDITRSFTNKFDSEKVDPDRKVPIIIGVVIAAIVVGVIVTGIVFYRRSQHTKLKHTKSNNEGKENTKSGGESVSNNTKSLRNNIRSNLKLTKAKAENMSDKRHENESCHQNQDYSSIDYANAYNLPGDKSARDGKTNVNETNLEKNVNTASDHSSIIYNNSLANTKMVGSEMVGSEMVGSEMVSSTSERIPQINGDLNGEEKPNLSQSQTPLDNTYSNFQNSPITVKDQDHKQIIQDASFPPNYVLATSLNLPVSDNTCEKPEALAMKPRAGEYSRLGDKSRYLKNPYNTLPDTDDSSPVTHFKGTSEIEEPFSNMSLEDPLAHIISCQNDYSFADYNRNRETEITQSEYHLATE